MVDRGRVERAAERPVHHVIAVGLVLAAHILDGEDVAGADQLGMSGERMFSGSGPKPPRLVALSAE